jgi:hypothetical protein
VKVQIDLIDPFWTVSLQTEQHIKNALKQCLPSLFPKEKGRGNYLLLFPKEKVKQSLSWASFFRRKKEGCKALLCCQLKNTEH